MCDAVTPHVVVFADLSPRAKVQYTRFLLENDVKFHRRDSDRRFVANIQLVKPKAASPSTKTQPVDEVQLREGSPDLVDKRLAAIPEEFHAYANLIVLIGERPERPTASPNYTKETRLVRFLNEIYDARYEDLSASCMNGGESFAKFIRHHLTNHFGLKRLVDQQAWDLIEGLSALQHKVDVELFSCFLQGKYPEPTLNFFLFARSRLQSHISSPVYRPVAVKVSSVPGRKRKPVASVSNTPAWLSRSQTEALAEIVFGAKSEDTYIEFMHAMKAFLACDSSIVRVRTPARLVDANEFLFIATETYHKSSFLSSNVTYEGAKTPCANARNERVAPEQFQACRPTPPIPEIPPAPAETASSTGAVVVDGNSEDDEEEAHLQSRLGSLLERVKKRQQTSSPRDCN